MFLDASAIIGIIALDDDAGSLAGRLSQARHPRTSAVAIFEAATRLAPIAKAWVADALALVGRFLKDIGAMVAGIDGDTAAIAVGAFYRFGKGRHPAALNMGDCFAYACAWQGEVKLLCNGNDFRGPPPRSLACRIVRPWQFSTRAAYQPAERREIRPLTPRGKKLRRDHLRQLLRYHQTRFAPAGVRRHTAATPAVLQAASNSSSNVARGKSRRNANSR